MLGNGRPSGTGIGEKGDTDRGLLPLTDQQFRHRRKLHNGFKVLFMDHAPVSWLDLVGSNDMERDRRYRAKLIEQGIFHFPTPTKQGSISFAHSRDDVATTLEITEQLVRSGL